jgi:NRPS condensation-like uncharacterized protein
MLYCHAQNPRAEIIYAGFDSRFVRSDTVRTCSREGKYKMSPRVIHAQRLHYPVAAADYVEYYVRSFADQQLRYVLAFDRIIDEERLARAVRLTLDAEPVLGCRFVMHPWHPSWQRRNDLDQVVLCSLTQTTALDQALHSFLTRAADPCRDPLVEVLILRSSTDTICIRLDHTVADASALKDFASLLASFYQQLEHDPSYRPPLTVPGDRSFRQVLHQFSLPQQIQAARQSTSVTGRWRFPTVSRDQSGPTVALRHLEVERLQTVKTYRSRLETTTSQILLTAFYRALFAVIQPTEDQPLYVQYSVDMRRYLPNRKAGAVCNLASLVYPILPARCGTSFDKTLVQVRNMMNAIGMSYPGLGNAVRIEALSSLGFALGHSLFQRTTGQAPPLFSNLGELGTPEYFGKAEVTDAYMVGPVMFPPGFMLATSSFHGKLTLAVGFCEAGTRRSDVEHFLDLFEQELP